MLKGSIVAIVTPMHDDLRVDMDAYKRLIHWHLDEGTDGILVAGTTGESPTLTDEETDLLIETAVKEVNGAIPVIAGTGCNATQKTIEKTKRAKALGVDAALIVTPYYNKPMQNGIYQHFIAIADAVDLPILLYNIPGRTAREIEPDVIAKLSQHKNIVGIKEATGHLNNVSYLREHSDPSFKIFSGEDHLYYDLLAAGGDGVISVTANVRPKAMHDVYAAHEKGDANTAKAIHDALMPLHQGLFVETNPIPVKYALYEMKKIEKGIRLPLTFLSEHLQAPLSAQLKGNA